MGIPTLISTSTASGASSVDITSGIDSTYDEYMFVCTDCSPSVDQKDFLCRFSTDGGTSYGVTTTSTLFQAHHEEDDTDAGLSYNAEQDLAQSTNAIGLASVVGSGADESAAMIMHLFSPSSTTFVKHYYFTCSHYAGNNVARTFHGAGYINTTSAVDAVQFYFLSAANTDGVFQMYGIA